MKKIISITLLLAMEIIFFIMLLLQSKINEQ
jgi:hypothetical protein